MPEAAWPPTTVYLVAPEGADRNDPSVSTHASIEKARSQVAYWNLYLPGECVIVEAVTAYAVVEQHAPDLQPARSR